MGGEERKKEGCREGRGSPPPPFQIPGSATVMWIISLLFRKNFLGFLDYNVRRPDTKIMTQKFTKNSSPATSFVL